MRTILNCLKTFPSSGASIIPFRGQLWYDTADARLKLFNGSDWKVAGGPHS